MRHIDAIDFETAAPGRAPFWQWLAAVAGVLQVFVVIGVVQHATDHATLADAALAAVISGP